MKYDLPKLPMLDGDTVRKIVVEESPEKKKVRTIGDIMNDKLTKPISPCELEDKRCGELSPKLVRTINEIIKEKWNGKVALVYFDEIGKRMNDPVVAKYVYPADVIRAYGHSGWDVKYEDFNGCFVFTKKE